LNPNYNAREDIAVQKDGIEAVILRVYEVCLEAQLRAVRRLQSGPDRPEPKPKGRSQIDLIQDILQRAGSPLHVTEIIERVEKVHGRRLDRESIVSALVKKVQRGDRFVRTDKNVFGLKGGQ
jgi:hypothetical protein